MAATPRQIRANRRNAEKSTGPTSIEGKERSRANALKHGCAGEGVILEEGDAAVLAERLITWRPSFVVATPEEEWLFVQMVTATVQVEACQARAMALRDDIAARASTCWDEDRRDEAESLAAGLSRRPSPVAARLETTLHGCEWMIDQWRNLRRALDGGGQWTERHVALAFDLLGVPFDFRLGTPGAPGESPRVLADREIARLDDLARTGLTPLDARRRSLAERGIQLEPSRELLRLERYEAAAFKKFERARKQLQAQTVPSTPPAPVEASKPAPPPTPKLQPASVAPARVVEEDQAPEPTPPPPVPTEAPSRRMNPKQLRDAARRAMRMMQGR